MAKPEFKELENTENMAADVRALGMQASEAGQIGNESVAGGWARKQIAKQGSTLGFRFDYRWAAVGAVGALLLSGLLGRRYYRR